MKPISKTAFYTCGIRAQDANSPEPICGDIYAERFMNKEAMEVMEQFKIFQKNSKFILYRHLMLTESIKKFLKANPKAKVVLIGAGFDTRAYQLGGGEWIEVDEPAVISHKNSALPIAKCPNPLTRIPIDFAKESLREKLSAYAQKSPTLFVIEGVLVYLEEEEISILFETLQDLFPHHDILCDLATRKIVTKYNQSFSKTIQKMAQFKFLQDNPVAFVQGKGYRIKKISSVFERVYNEGKLVGKPNSVSRWILNLFFKTALQGSLACHFETRGNARHP
ncbi:MAG: hypothetical protein B6244_08880 [Candidatus Cloacimonetes bacterium 4572_55]|nr:MAG: hypothetical protein B6244_08880 [Candidatus Cloacimonetes bacterium 4572_55]